MRQEYGESTYDISGLETHPDSVHLPVIEVSKVFWTTVVTYLRPTRTQFLLHRAARKDAGLVLLDTFRGFSLICIIAIVDLCFVNPLIRRS